MDRFVSLALFAAAVSEGSLAAAGRRFNLSPAVAGKHLHALETELQVRLLQRTTRRLALTEAGQAFLPRCHRILAEFDQALREVSDAKEQVCGTLRVAAPTEFAVTRLGGVVAQFAKAYSALEVNLRLDDRYVDLVANEVDIAVRIGRLTDPNLITRRIGRCQLVFCASPAFLARHGTPLVPTDLDALPRLTFSESVSADDWTVIGPDGTKHTVTARTAVSANNVQFLSAAAVFGAGIVYGPDFVFADSLVSGALVRVLADWDTPTLDIHAVYPAARHIPKKVQCFVDHLVKSIAGSPVVR